MCKVFFLLLWWRIISAVLLFNNDFYHATFCLYLIKLWKIIYPMLWSMISKAKPIHSKFMLSSCSILLCSSVVLARPVSYFHIQSTMVSVSYWVFFFHNFKCDKWRTMKMVQAQVKINKFFYKWWRIFTGILRNIKKSLDFHYRNPCHHLCQNCLNLDVTESFPMLLTFCL